MHTRTAQLLVKVAGVEDDARDGSHASSSKSAATSRVATSRSILSSRARPPRARVSQSRDERAREERASERGLSTTAHIAALAGLCCCARDYHLAATNERRRAPAPSARPIASSGRIPTSARHLARDDSARADCTAHGSARDLQGCRPPLPSDRRRTPGHPHRSRLLRRPRLASLDRTPRRRQRRRARVSCRTSGQEEAD